MRTLNIKMLKNRQIRRILRSYPIPMELWEPVKDSCSVLQGLSAVEFAHLRELVTMFLYKKRFTGVNGLQVTPEIMLNIAAQACLPILKLDLEYYSGWIEIILYPNAFRIARDKTDSDGIVHHEESTLRGESWSRGPIVLSWGDIEQDLKRIYPGRNIVIHEFAHKLDLLNGSANGMPPLHSNMLHSLWTETLQSAFEKINQQVKEGVVTHIDPYAATEPGEFFAVVSEYFFAAPNLLFQQCPDVYQQLKLFYRQDTLLRIDDIN